MNTTIYKVDLSSINPAYEANSLYGYNIPLGDQGIPGWVSFTKDTAEQPALLAGTEVPYSAAEYVDGYVYATTKNELHVMRPGEHTPDQNWQYYARGILYTISSDAIYDCIRYGI